MIQGKNGNLMEKTGMAAMPRRDFIRKSLLASGGAFVGMSLGENMSLPQLHKMNGGMTASEEKREQRRTYKKEYGGKTGGYSW